MDVDHEIVRCLQVYVNHPVYDKGEHGFERMYREVEGAKPRSFHFNSDAWFPLNESQNPIKESAGNFQQRKSTTSNY